MSHFVEDLDSDRYLNLDHVAVLASRKDNQDDYSVYACYSPSGEQIGRISIETLDIFEPPRNVVPETRNSTLIGFSLYEDALYITRLPVIAWDITKPRRAIPICVEDYEEYPDGDTIWCLETPGTGAWIFLKGEYLHMSSFAEAEQHALARLRKQKQTRVYA